MSKRINRQELIIAKATELFMAQGYVATSVRQIAEAAGCTDAALYYHFKEGKRALFQAVVESNLPDFWRLLESCREAKSLGEIIINFGGQNISENESILPRLRWIVTEYPLLSTEEQSLIHRTYLTFQSELAALVKPFVENEAMANETAWIMVFTLFGYVQTFVHLGMEDVVDFPLDKLKNSLAVLLEQYQLKKE
jgi:AcrR family transcriptional regulator